METMTQPEQEAREMLAACPCGRAATFLPDDSYGSCQAGCNCEAEPYIARPIGQEAECIAAWNAFAARPTAGIDHKALIAELTAQAWKEEPGQTMHLTASFRAAYALTLADVRIAELESVKRGDIGMAITEAEAAAKTGERGAVIEECARVCDQLFQRATHSDIEAFAYQAAAKAIRALSQPLPDAPIVGGEG